VKPRHPLPAPPQRTPESAARPDAAFAVGDDVFRALFAAYPDALLVSDAQGTIVLANPSAAALLGYAEGELIGLGVDMLVPDSIRPRHADYRNAYAKNPRPRPMSMQTQLVAKCKDGSEVMVEIALSPVQGSHEPLVIAAIRDIGAYPRVKQALQRARYSECLAELGQLAVDARDPQVVLARVPQIATRALQADLATVWLAVGDGQTCELVSVDSVETAGSATALEPLGTRVANRPDTAPGYVLAQGQPVRTADLRSESRFSVPQAHLNAGLTSALAVPLSDRGRCIGALIVSSRELRAFGADELRFLESLSNLLATSLQRAQSEEALNHAQRLESVGQLTGGIAHDFNNLLTVIQGNLQVLEELPALAEQGHALQLAAAAARASKRGSELTSKLLAFSRRQVLQPSPVDVNALLRSLCDMLQRTLDQRIAIEVDAPPCPPCLADAGQLESALLNIAINARDAMPGGGRLRFHAEPCATMPADVHGGAEPRADHPGEYIAISITDTGTGMTDEVKERAFEPFFTTKESGRGTGLGLSTVHGFVTQSHGGIAIRSAPGAGTTVTLYIPRIDALPASPPAAELSAKVRPGLRVLLVEDDADVRALMHAFLLALGCRVTACSSGEQAWNTLAWDARYELLLTDIALGAGMRGTELAARAQGRLPTLAVLLMSGYSAELLDADRSAPPTWELLRKPCTREELARAIASVVNGR
jgi:PAS domain S-box-containing protein